MKLRSKGRRNLVNTELFQEADPSFSSPNRSSPSTASSSARTTTQRSPSVQPPGATAVAAAVGGLTPQATPQRVSPAVPVRAVTRPKNGKKKNKRASRPQPPAEVPAVLVDTTNYPTTAQIAAAAEGPALTRGLGPLTPAVDPAAGAVEITRQAATAPVAPPPAPQTVCQADVREPAPRSVPQVMVTRHVQPVPQQAQRRVMMTDVVVHDDYRESGEQTVSLGALQAKKQKTFEAILGEDFDTNSTAYRIIAYCLNKSPELAGRELAYTEPLMAGSIHGWILMILFNGRNLLLKLNPFNDVGGVLR
jgi:hypothetical protein